MHLNAQGQYDRKANENTTIRRKRINNSDFQYIHIEFNIV
jgi:hypothetical protein